MQTILRFLIAPLLAGRLLALDGAVLDAVTAKFANSPPDQQHAARVELNRLIDDATAPGKSDAAGVNRTLIGAIESATTPVEAKKYLLRALARTANAECVPSMQCLMAGSDAMLREEARQVLSMIPGDEADRALRDAIDQTTDAAFRRDLEAAIAFRNRATANPAATSAVAEFLAKTADRHDAGRANLVRQALASDDERLRHKALRIALDEQHAPMDRDVTATVAAMPTTDRIIVLQEIDRIASPADAEAIALAGLQSAEIKERLAAIRALGKIPTRSALHALLGCMAAREPAIQQAAGHALSMNRYENANAELVSRIAEPAGADKQNAIKALAHRAMPQSGATLIGLITGDDPDASKEAMRSLYFTCSLDDLRMLCSAVAAVEDPAHRSTLASLCTRIADRLDTDEARALAAGVK